MSLNAFSSFETSFGVAAKEVLANVSNKIQLKVIVKNTKNLILFSFFFFFSHYLFK